MPTISNQLPDASPVAESRPEARVPALLAGLRPGQRVRVTQTIARRAGDWHPAVEGTIAAVEQQKTGSWHAFGKDWRVWLWRIRLVKDDGEESVLVVDQYTTVDVLPPAEPAPGADLRR